MHKRLCYCNKACCCVFEDLDWSKKDEFLKTLQEFGSSTGGDADSLFKNFANFLSKRRAENFVMPSKQHNINSSTTLQELLAEAGGQVLGRGMGINNGLDEQIVGTLGDVVS